MLVSVGKVALVRGHQSTIRRQRATGAANWVYKDHANWQLTPVWVREISGSISLLDKNGANQEGVAY